MFRRTLGVADALDEFRAIDVGDVSDVRASLTPPFPSCVFCTCYRALRDNDHDGQLLEHMFHHTTYENIHQRSKTSRWMLETRNTSVSACQYCWGRLISASGVQRSVHRA